MSMEVESSSADATTTMPSSTMDGNPPAAKRKRGELDEDVKSASMMTSSPFETGVDILKLLLKTKCEFVTPPNNVVFVCTREDRVVDVWKGLIKHNFLSVPVLSKTEHRYFGFLDLADIVRHLVKQFADESMSTAEFWEKIEEEKSFGHLTVNDIMQSPQSSRNPFHPVRRGYSLLHAFEILAREPSCHRVPVLSEDRHLLNVITQSQAIGLLYKNISALGAKMDKPLHECHTLFKSVVSINESALAISAFEKMVEREVSGLAVVDDDGKLVGNLSLRDLKLVGFDIHLFWRFYQSIKNFIVKLRKEYQEKHNRPKHIVHVTADVTLGHVLELLATNNIHRVYIVDKDTKPIGLVSLKDLLEQLLEM